MASAKIFRINYKSDFILTLTSDAGWMTPFCIKFWTGSPMLAYYASWDGETYTHCAPVAGDSTKLLVQFDDHHLPIGDLKFQIGYHFTVADFPNDTEDEVLNQANITTEIDGEEYQVMLDFTGETAPEIQFSLPAYANEAQRIANEQQRIANETQRIANEETRIQHEESRIAAEQTRQQNEQQRINQEQARVEEYAGLKADAVAATGAANDAAALANQKAQLAADKAALAGAAATLANAKAQLAADKAALADAAATLANQKAALAQQKAEYAQEQGTYSKNQGDYAKEQGDYSKAKGDYAKDQGDYSKSKGDYAKDQGDYSKQQGDYAKEQGEICAADHLVAVEDHQTATADNQTAAADHQTAIADHNQASNDHTRAESDHTRAESDHAAVEVYVDSLGVFDLSKHNAVGGVLATYADLSAALTALNTLDSKYKYGGMSFKFVQSSDNKYVQYRLMSDSWSINPEDWSIADEGAYVVNPEFVYVKTDAEDKILWAIRANGDIFYGAGVPPQIVEYAKKQFKESVQDNIINGKKIVCLGDSISYFIYNNKGWIEHFNDISGCDAIRGAIGGTRIVPRGEATANPTNANEAYCGLDIYNIAKSWATNDYTIADACSDWIRVHGTYNYNVELANLKNNPIGSTDIVIIFGGTNDFVDNSNRDIFEAKLKEIITMLLTANPELKIYVFTPLVRYVGTTRDDSHWCDNYKRADGLTLVDFVNSTIVACNDVHVPVCDLYTTLGWNRTNFSIYFIDGDNVHPYKGFKQLAEEIYNFLIGKSCAKNDKSKVDKVEGKSLINTEYASAQHAVKSQEFLEVKTDLESKILEATTVNGRKQFYVPIDTPARSTDYADDVDWTEIHLNEDKKIISGIHKDGSTYIGQFDDKTEDTIKQVCSENYDFVIPVFDSEFSAPVPYKIFNGEVEDESVKGTDNAKYVFDLSLSKKAFNIRFKFRITENIYNEQKSCVVASLGLVPIISAKPEKLVQHTTTVSYNGENKTMYWPTLKGGVSMGQSMSLQYSAINNNNLGLFAFYLKYSGTSHDVTIENDGSAFILKIDGVATTFSYSNYPTVQELYEALKAVADIEISCGGIEGRNCNELAVFEESKLVSLCYTRTDGIPTSSVEEYWDSAPFFIPYAIDETWHQVEVVKIQDNVYSVCDGNTAKIGSISNILTLGGECGVLFKDLEVCCNTSADAEVTDLGIISGVCPNILVFEGHGMDTRPTCEIPNPSTSLVATPDRLQYLFGFLKSKGYIPVSLKDVSEFYDGSKTLPKRCYVPVFDDYEFENCMELKNRSVFTGFGVKPALAIVTGYSSSHTITHNGTTITIQDAAAICKTYDFYLVSHTRNHRSCTSIKPSEYLDELIDDVYDGDVKGVDNSILVYPFGNSNAYLADSLKWLGYKLGIQVAPDSSFNKKARSRYTIIRQELGLRNSLQDLLERII